MIMKKKNFVKTAVNLFFACLLFSLPTANAQLELTDDVDCDALINYVSQQVVGNQQISQACNILNNLNRDRLASSGCQAPTGLSAEAFNFTGLQVNWLAVNNALGYLVTYQNLTTGATGQVQTSNTSYTFNSLPPGIYIISVQTMCQDQSLSYPTIIVRVVIITDIAMIRSELPEKECECKEGSTLYSGPFNEDELVLAWDEDCPGCTSKFVVEVQGADQGYHSFDLGFSKKLDYAAVVGCRSGNSHQTTNHYAQTYINVLIEGRKVFLIRFSESIGMVIDGFDPNYDYNVVFRRCHSKDREESNNLLNGGIRSAGTDATIPTKAAMSSFPNPFEQQLQVQYSVVKDGPVAIKLYDYSGKVVALPRALAMQEKGNYQLYVDTSNLPAGLY